MPKTIEVTLGTLRGEALRDNNDDDDDDDEEDHFGSSHFGARCTSLVREEPRYARTHAWRVCANKDLSFTRDLSHQTDVSITCAQRNLSKVAMGSNSNFVVEFIPTKSVLPHHHLQVVGR